MQENFEITKFEVPLIKGVTFTLPIANLKLNDDGTQTIVDMSSCTASMNIKDSVNATTVILALDSDDHGIVIDTVAGTITVTITAEQSNDEAFVLCKKLVGDLILTQSDEVTNELLIRLIFKVEGRT